VTLTAPCFRGPHWIMSMQIPDLIVDADAHYAFHRSILQTLQHRAPTKTWLLKTPAHLMTLGQLFATYPDAWVVQTHRDPLKTMPSTVSTAAMIQWLRRDAVDLPMLANGVNLAFSAALLGVIEQRASGAVPARFVDLHFQSMMKDPVESLRVAYAQMERDFRPEHAERIRAYLANKPQGKFGSHRYTPEEWGFDTGDLRERLRPYVEHYGVELES